MKLIIDTNKDSPQDIKKAIAFLESLSGSSNNLVFKPESKKNDDFPMLNADMLQPKTKTKTVQNKEEPEEGSLEIIPY
jgi:hypothetical protein